MFHHSRAAFLGATALSGITSVRAEADPAAEIRTLMADITKKIDAQNKAFDTFKAENDAAIKDVVHADKVDRINADITKVGAEIDAMNAKLAALQLNGTGSP